MSAPTVSLDWAITTAKGVYTVSEARLELANLETALAEVEKRETILRGTEEETDG